MLRAIAIDDEELALEMLKETIKKEGSFQLLDAYTDPIKAIARIKAGKLDIIFLDIEMPGINGLEFAEKIMGICPGIEIIFVTAYDKYAFKAFGTHAIGYLLKPVSVEDLKKEAENIMRRYNGRGASKTKLHIKCFGSFSCQRYDTGENLSFRTSKSEELIAFLISRREQMVTRMQIVEALWPNMPLDSGINNFHVTMHYIKKLFDGCGIDNIISRSREGYKIVCEAICCDLYAFEKIIEALESSEKASQELLLQAFHLYKGAYLYDNGYEWAIDKQRILERSYIKIGMKLYENYISQNDMLEAQKVLITILHYNPLFEAAHEKLINLYIDSGDIISAIKQYRILKKVMEEELEIQPSEEIRKLIKKYI